MPDRLSSDMRAANDLVHPPRFWLASADALLLSPERSAAILRRLTHLFVNKQFATTTWPAVASKRAFWPPVRAPFAPRKWPFRAPNGAHPADFRPLTSRSRPPAPLPLGDRQEEYDG